MVYHDILRTKLFNPREDKLDLIDKRRQRILEALSWKRGTIKKPKEYLVDKIDNGVKIYFLKPGKETQRKIPNPHDMTPMINAREKPYQFDDIWIQLSKVSVVDEEMFKAILTLIYRNAYMLDHQFDGRRGGYRYRPNAKILDCINQLNNKLKKSKNNCIDYGLLGLLHFLDILGWNEDVKYHIEKNKPTFKGKYKWNSGRVNTLLSCIKVPYKTHVFVENVQKNSATPINIDWSLAYETMQLLLRTRGVCPPSRKELLDWLKKYIFE